MNINLPAALWRTRIYIQPELKHFALYALLIGVGMLLELATFLFGFDLLSNKVFLAEPLSPEQASLLGLPSGQYVDVAALGTEAREVLRNVFLGFMVATIVIGFVLGASLPYYLTWILQRVNQHLRLAMMDRAVNLSLRFHQDSEVGDAVYRVYQDSAMVTNVIENGVINPAISLGNLAIAFVTLAFFSPNLGGLFLIGAVISIAIVIPFTPVLRKRSVDARAANSALTSHIQESVANVRLLKANSAEGRAVTHFDNRSREALDRGFEIRRTVATLSLLIAFTMGTVALVADYIMVTWVWNEDATFGFGLVSLVGFAIWNLGAFQAARDRAAGIGGGAGQLARLWSVLQDMSVGLDRAFYLLDVEPEVVDSSDALPMPKVAEGITARDVSFSYDAGRPVLDRVTFSATPGTTTAIVGSTGAGKSTLLSLLLRLFERDGGEFSIDGVDLRDIRLQELRDGIAVVLQENALFPTSVADNIRYAVPDATDDAVRASADVACANEFIQALDEGYETLLGERGAKLSTGQRQRLSIARAVLKDAPILVLDEPTASLDVQTELAVLRRLAEWGEDKIIFFVTHRIATVRAADQILFLEDGRVVEAGPHDALMAKPEGRYRRFVTAELEVPA